MNWWQKILLFVLAIIIYYVIVALVGFLYCKIKHIKKPVSDFKKNNVDHYSKLNFILYFPFYAVKHYFETPPIYFDEYGLWLICGKQGSGKTLTMTYFLNYFKKKYPEVKVATNYDYEFQDFPIIDSSDIPNINNGEKGLIYGLDELQNWFKSGKDQLPTEMLQVITQNRKNRRLIIGTSQVLIRVNKAIREQATYILEPITLFNSFTWVNFYTIDIDGEGNIVSKNRVKSIVFRHSLNLYNNYDTLKVIN